MKRNSHGYNFETPTRQSLVAILMIVLKTYRILVTQAWPFLLLFLFNGKSGSGQNKWIIGLAAFALIGMVYSIINYFRYYFYLDDNELVIESGVFKRSKLNVPFDRIQTINFEQNIIHRIFNVVRLKVDTAGSSKAEFQFHALDSNMANELREILLSKKKSSINQAVEDPTELKEEEYKTIMQLSLLDLIKAGAVENHMRSAGIIIAFMFWIRQSLDDININVENEVERTVNSQIGSGLIFASILIVLFFLLSFTVSMFKMIISNYDLKFMRSKSGFKINAGLFTKKDTSALDHKIQVISWGDNPLKKLIGIKDLRLKQASSVAVSKKTSIKVPSCSEEHINLVKDTLYGKDSLKNIDFLSIDKRYFYRNGGILTLIFMSVLAVLIYLEQLPQAFIIGLVAIFVILSFYLAYRKKRYGYNDEMLVIRGGTYGDSTEMLPIYKIQSLSREQTPYQRRNGLANLVVHTAAGKVGIPYISNDAVKKIMDVFLYRIETDRRKWI